MADSIKKSSETSSRSGSIPLLFKNMVYGPVEDSCSFAKAWLQDRKLGPFIDGAFRGNSTTEDDINEAVNSSLKAADAWSKLSPHQRARHLYSLARHLQKHGTILAQMESLNRGVQSRDPREFDVPTMVRYFYHYAGWAQLLSDPELMNWQPLGVVAGITSSSSPLAVLAFIIAPALAAGNTICLKPSGTTPLPTLLFASIASQAGLPAGVINVLPGGADIGKMLVTHAQITKVTYSGSTAVGRLIREETAGLGIHITMLLNGGKSSMIVFDSADIDSAVDTSVDAAWFNQGQAPWSMGRLLVQDSIWDDFNRKLRARIQQLRVGPAFDHQADVGSPLNKKAVSDVQEAVKQAEIFGLEVFQKPLPSELSPEEYFLPTLVIGGLPYNNKIMDEDVTVPLIATVPFRTAKEAIALANNSRHGLVASVWTENSSLAMEVASLLQVGTVWINSHGLMDASVPFGGWKQSGLGEFGGKQGLLEYMQYRGVRCNMTTAEVNYMSFGMSDYASACYPDPQTSSKHEPEVDCTYKLYYGGAHKRPDSSLSRTVSDGTGKIFAAVPEGSRKDVRNAVEAAVKAQPGWWKQGSHGRSQILYNAAEKLQFRRDEFISRLTTLYGHTDEDFAATEVDCCLNLLFHWAALCDKKLFTAAHLTLNGNAVSVTREPAGVIGIVQPTSPQALLSFIALFAPAVCYGNVVVVLAENVHPTPAIEFCQVIDTSDFPPGVVNVLTGSSERMLTTLATHQEVAALWAPCVTGTVAKYIQWASKSNLKHTWVDKIPCLEDPKFSTDCRELFELHSTKTKCVWMPYGEIFAN